MKCNFSNLLRNAAEVIDPKRDQGAYAYMLGVVADQVDGVRTGRFTLDQFADHYMVRPNAEEKPELSQTERDTALAALRGAVGALEFSRDYHSDLSNSEQAFAQDKLDAVTAAIATLEARS